MKTTNDIPDIPNIRTGYGIGLYGGDEIRIHLAVDGMVRGLSKNITRLKSVNPCDTQIKTDWDLCCLGNAKFQTTEDAVDFFNNLPEGEDDRIQFVKEFNKHSWDRG
jgi:hypothetical protein